MPELPEVETIAGQLNRSLPLKIRGIEWSKYGAKLLKRKEVALTGSIKRAFRLGKALVMELENGFLVSRLGMSGGWKFKGKYKHTHLQITGDDITLKYIDPRRFGAIYLVKKLDDFRVIDLNSPDFNLNYLRSVLKRGRGELRPFLLNQKYFPGIGNYMANEACYYAGIRPNRKVSEVDALALLRAIKKVIRRSTKSGGLSFHGGYQDAFHEKGRFKTKVFWRKFCSCGAPIVKIKQSGRSSYFCQRCQN